MKNILFLGHRSKKIKLINFLKKKKFKVSCINKPLDARSNLKIYDLIISFGYRHIIDTKILKKCKRPIINLHISYLPFNKGAHPNFWSFIEGTPSGVTIHEINSGIDTGNIIFQKFVNIDLYKNKSLTFNKIYEKLLFEIENLFLQNFDNIMNKKYISYKQNEIGTFHTKNQLPKAFIKSWDQNILKVKNKYLSHMLKLKQKRISLINDIENTRKNNNVNWMNLLKIAIKTNPVETIKVLKKINTDDNKISKLFKQIH